MPQRWSAASVAVYPDWNNGITGVPITTGSSASTVWITWAVDATTTTSAQVSDVWPHWIHATTTVVSYGSSPVNPEEQERLRASAAQRREEQAAAGQRARELLVATLNRRQRREFSRDGCFHIHKRNGRRTYRLRPGSQPVRVKGEDGRRWAYCIHPHGSFPADDVTLAHKLLLDHDEEEFLRIANASVA